MKWKNLKHFQRICLFGEFKSTLHFNAEHSEVQWVYKEKFYYLIEKLRFKKFSP